MFAIICIALAAFAIAFYFGTRVTSILRNDKRMTEIRQEIEMREQQDARVRRLQASFDKRDDMWTYKQRLVDTGVVDRKTMDAALSKLALDPTRPVWEVFPYIITEESW